MNGDILDIMEKEDCRDQFPFLLVLYINGEQRNKTVTVERCEINIFVIHF